jgi:hypothetical protein
MTNIYITTYLLPAVNELVSALLREIFFAQELFAAVEMIMGRILMLLRNAIGKTVAHTSDFVHDTPLFSFGIITVTDILSVSVDYKSE